MSLSTKRILIDLLDIADDPIPDVIVHMDEANIQEVIVILIGPEGTPYDGGVFPFTVRFTNRYPADPPKVLFLSPNEKIRFHPNLYETGKVCLSILGTWTGPEWTSVMNLRSLILSLQSIMSENPLRNEPGFETESILGRRNKNFNSFIQYVTVKYAIVETLNHFYRLKDAELREKVLDYVKHNTNRYEHICQSVSQFSADSGDDGYLLRTMYGMKINIDVSGLLESLRSCLQHVKECSERSG